MRNEIKDLDISGRGLDGNLVLKGFSNLERLDCSNNQLNDVNISELNPEKLIYLNLMNNFISHRNIELFGLSKFVNLSYLFIGIDKCGQHDYYNNFHGSLEAFKDLHKLKYLDIQGTNISYGLEYLPLDNLEAFYCSPVRKGSKVAKIHEQLCEDMNERMQQLRKIQQKKRPNANDNSQLKELADLLLPNTPYNFIELKQEMMRLKIAELAPQVRGKRSELEQLTTNAKSKAGTNLEIAIDLLLKTQIDIVKEKKEKDQFAQNQLVSFESILQGKLTNEEIRALQSKQVEVFTLENNLEKLQQSQGTEHQAQIQQADDSTTV